MKLERKNEIRRILQAVGFKMIGSLHVEPMSVRTSRLASQMHSHSYPLARFDVS